MNIKYLVGKHISSHLYSETEENSNVEIVGIFSNVGLAEKACRSRYHFILKLEEDVDLGNVPNNPSEEICWFLIK